MTYRPATRAEFNTAVSWAAAEGWNPGRHDADIFWRTDPSGYVCAERDGEIVATGSVVAYGDAFGFMGFFIVRPDLRGQGIGRAFWHWRRDTLRARLRPNAAIGMDGVFAMQSFYARGGFAFSHRNLRMAGTAAAHPLTPAERNLLHPLAALPFAQVAAFDREHFGFDRTGFLAGWIEPIDRKALAVMRGGEIRALGVIRPCQTGYKIGPLFARDAAAADLVFRALSTGAEGCPLALDTPANNPAALALAGRYGLTEGFGCARMYHGPAPALPWSRIYGVTTFELG